MVVSTQTLIWLDGLLTLISILFAAWQGRPWISPLTSKEKFTRAILIGISVAIGVPTLLTYFDLRKEPAYIGSSYAMSFLLLLCFCIPLSLIAMVGSYISLTILDELRKRYLDSNN